MLGPNAPADAKVFERREGGGIISTSSLSAEDMELRKQGKLSKEKIAASQRNSKEFIEQENRKWHEANGTHDYLQM